MVQVKKGTRADAASRRSAPMPQTVHRAGRCPGRGRSGPRAGRRREDEVRATRWSTRVRAPPRRGRRRGARAGATRPTWPSGTPRGACRGRRPPRPGTVAHPAGVRPALRLDRSSHSFGSKSVVDEVDRALAARATTTPAMARSTRTWQAASIGRRRDVPAHGLGVHAGSRARTRPARAPDRGSARAAAPVGDRRDRRAEHAPRLHASASAISCRRLAASCAASVAQRVVVSRWATPRTPAARRARVRLVVHRVGDDVAGGQRCAASRPRLVERGRAP